MFTIFLFNILNQSPNLETITIVFFIMTGLMSTSPTRW